MSPSSIPSRKNIPLYRNSELRHRSKQPGPTKRGGSRVVRNAGRVAVDAAASRTRGRGQGGLLSVSPGLRADERRCVRTAKPCGPGRRCYGQALAEAACASTGAVSVNFAGAREARTNSAPGRARHKPSNHCAGKAVCWASPVCRCAVLLRYMRTADRGCQPAPGLPCALFFTGRRREQTRAECAARM